MGETIERRLSTGRRVYYARYYDADGKRKLRKTGQLKLTDARIWLAAGGGEDSKWSGGPERADAGREGEGDEHHQTAGAKFLPRCAS